MQYYRDESKIIFSIVKKHCRLIEKGGTDEAYIQITKEDLLPFENETTFNGVILSAHDPLKPADEQEILIMKASNLAARIRQ